MTTSGHLCLNGCSLRGSCQLDGSCVCYPGYGGVDCGEALRCPNDCRDNGIASACHSNRYHASPIVTHAQASAIMAHARATPVTRVTTVPCASALLAARVTVLASPDAAAAPPTTLAKLVSQHGARTTAPPLTELNAAQMASASAVRVLRDPHASLRHVPPTATSEAAVTRSRARALATPPGRVHRASRRGARTTA